MPYFKTLALFVGLLLAGCLSPEEFQQKNDPDTVVKFASRHLDGKRPKTDWAKVLESSFKLVNDSDLLRIDSLKMLGTTAAAWEKIHAINLRIERRHRRVGPLLPIVTEDGYRPNIKLLPIEDMLAESRQEVIARSLPDIEENLQLALDGQRLKARTAYSRIAMLRKKYQWAGSQADDLQSEALVLGRSYVLMEVESRGRFFEYNRIVERLNLRGIGGNDLWQVVHLSPQPDVSYDFRGKLEIVNAGVSGESTSTSCTSYSAKVEVGIEEVKDTNGVVISRTPIFETVTATKVETIAQKDAQLLAELTLYDYITGEELSNRRISASDNYNATSCSVSGDSRAFTGSCFWGFISFPSDWAMMDNCTDDLRFTIDHLLDKVDLKQ